MSSLNQEYIFAPAPLTKRGSPIFFGGDVKSKNVVYVTGTAIVIRSLENLLSADMYYEHPCQPTVAKYSPSGFYIASGDVQGNIRIWDTTQKEHPLKFEFRALSGAIMDLAWNGENNRIIAVGDGKEKFGLVFMWDAGSTVGEISGHTKCLISCDYKPNRPYRVVTCGEDMQVGWSEGPPFKFKKRVGEHTRFVNCVRFSPDGNRFVSCGSDKKVIVYDGKTGDKIVETDPVHKGGVYGVAWGPDNNTFLTVSGDKTAIFWDANTGHPLSVVSFPDRLEQQQLGCYWLANHIISCNLDGDISVLDRNVEHPTRVLLGHNKFISALCAIGNKIYTASYDGRIIEWNYATGETAGFSGKGHTNQVMQMVVDRTATATEPNIISCGMDDCILITSATKRTYSTPIGMESPCTGVVCVGDCIVVSTVKDVRVVRGGGVVCAVPAAGWCPSCVCVNGRTGEVAVGGKDDRCVHFFSLEGDTLKETSVMPAMRGAVTALEYSPDGKWLATADTSRNIFIWEADTKKLVVEGWIFHTAKVTCLAWSADSVHLLSGGLDSSIYVWNVNQPDKRLYVKSANYGGVTACTWINEKVVATAGMDCALKTWTVVY